MTSALYELGGPGTRQTTMRPSGRTAQAPEAGGEPIRLPSVYVQSRAVPGLLRTCAVSPELVITVEALFKERLAPHETGRGIMGWERGRAKQCCCCGEEAPWGEGKAGPGAQLEQVWVGVQGVEDAGGLEDSEVPQSKPACVMCV